MALTVEENNYVLGRGKVYFDQFKPQSFTPTGEMYFGNTPAFSLSQGESKLDHYSSEGGVNVKDRSIILQQDTSGSLTTDNISQQNVALWWLGQASALAIAAGSNLTEVVTDVKLGSFYQVGSSDDLPQGHGDLTALTVNSAQGVKASGTVTFTGPGSANDTVTIGGSTITLKASGAVGAQINIGADLTATALALSDYINAHQGTLGVKATPVAGVVTVTAIGGGTPGNAITLAKSGTVIAVSGANLTGGAAGAISAAGNFDLDLPLGRIQWFTDATDISDGDDLTITYSNSAISTTQVIAKGTSVVGRLRFVADNPEGENTDAFFPYVRITPNGDFNLKGDNWQELQFSIEVLKLNSTTDRAYWTRRG